MLDTTIRRLRKQTTLCDSIFSMASIVTIGFTPLSTIFQLYRYVSIIVGGKPEYQEKTTDLPQVTDKLYHLP
jgi:hypothetical protein